MSAPSAQMSVLAGKQFACIKISGRANFSSSIDFRSVVTELCQRGYGFFVLELSECLLMDSTFLGVLTGFGLKLNRQKNSCIRPGIDLLNPNPRIIELLESLGVLHLFTVSHGTPCTPEDAQTSVHEPLNPSKDEVRRACLEAHETLMQVNPDNVPKFKDITQFLAEDLRKAKT